MNSAKNEMTGETESSFTDKEKINPEMTGGENRIGEKPKSIYVLSVFLGNFFWGFGIVLMKVAQGYTSNIVMLAHRFTLAFLLMTVWLIIGKRIGKVSFSFKGKNIRRMIVFMMVEPVCFFLESYALQLTNATIGGVTSATTSISAIIMAMIFIKEYPTAKQVIYMVIAVMGVIFLTVSGNSLGIVSLKGLVMIVAFLIASGTYKILNKVTAGEFNTFERTYCLIGSCSITYLITGLVSCRGDMGAFVEPIGHAGYVAAVIFMAVVCSIISNGMVNYGAGVVSVTTVAAMTPMITVVSTIIGVLCLKEPITLSMIICIAVILFSVLQVNLNGK